MFGVVYYKFRGRLSHPSDPLLDMLGFSRDEFEASRLEWPRMISPDSRLADEQEWELLRRNGRAGPVEINFIHKTGASIRTLVCRANVEAGRHENGIALVMSLHRPDRAGPAASGVEAELHGVIEGLKQRLRDRTAELDVQSERMRVLGRQAAEAASRQRQHVAQVLHDHFQQLVSAAKMKIGVLRRRSKDQPVVESLRQSEDLLQAALDSSRSLAGELSVPIAFELPANLAIDPARASEAIAAHPAPRAMRVLVADDHKLFREGLICLLLQQPQFVVVGESGDGQQAVEMARQLRPDVLIVDVAMPRLNGVQVTSLLSREMPRMKIVGLSVHDREEMADAMRNAGAVAYCPKNAPVDELVSILRKAAASDDAASAGPS